MNRLWGAATQRPVSYASEAGPFTHTPLGWVLHVVVGNGSPFWTFQNAVSPNRRFSHLWVSKTGGLEQYQGLDFKSWAQGAGNGDYWSVETEGFPNEPLTEAQLNTLAEWHVYSGTADAVADSPGAVGIGTHSMGGLAWGGHACPGSVRAGQRAEIIRRAKLLRSPVPIPTRGGFPMFVLAVIGEEAMWLCQGRNAGGTYDWEHVRGPSERDALLHGLGLVSLSREAATYYFGAIPTL